MIVKRPYRSAMWPGCQVVRPARSAQIGTASSAATRATKLTMPAFPSSVRRAIHRSWHAVMPTA